jgi:endonuclease/exonuclease/phosphatase (EEP) superfamily protein YafD
LASVDWARHTAAVITLALIGRLAVVVLFLPVLARLARLDRRNGLVAMLVTFLPWLLVPAAALVVVGAAIGDWLLAAMAGFLALFVAVWARPEWARPSEDVAVPNGPIFTVATANIWEKTPDVTSLLAYIDGREPDVVALQEVHQRHEERLADSGLAARRPHRVPMEAGVERQTVVLSRIPFVSAERINASFTPYLAVVVDIDGLEVTILAIHPPPPSTSFAAWRSDFVLLAELVRSHEGPLVVLGDCNATLQHRFLRDVLDAGLRDAHLVRGRGLGWTWRHARYPGPPLRLDRVMVTKEIDVVSIRVGEPNGSDHSPVFVELALKQPQVG